MLGTRPSRLQRAMKDGDKGITLIEILIALAIIGAIAAWGIPQFLKQQQKGVDGSLKNDLSTMAMQQETWKTDNPGQPGLVYPGTGTPPNDAGTILNFKPSPGNTITVTTKVDPVTGQSIGYCITGENDNSSHGKGKEMYWDSATGGLGTNSGWTPPTGGAC